MPELLLATHQGPPELRVIPHGFFKLGSIVGAMPVMSETRLVCL